MPYIKNPNYNPNDPNSKRYVPSYFDMANQSYFDMKKQEPQSKAVFQPQSVLPKQGQAPIPSQDKPGVKKATLHAPDGSKKVVVEVGSNQASQLLGQGYTLTPKTTTITPKPITEPKPKKEQQPTETVTDTNKQLAELAAKAGLSVTDYTTLLGSQTAISQQDREKIKNELGIPDLINKAFKTPEKRTVEKYKELYELSGLPDLKEKIATKEKAIEARRRDLVKATGEIENNPWLSQASRTGRLRILNELAQADLNNLIYEKDQLNDLYDSGITEIEKTINYDIADLETDRQLTVDKLNYLLGEAEQAYTDTQAKKKELALRYIPDFLKAATQPTTADKLSTKDLLDQAQGYVEKGLASNISEAISMIRDIQAGGTGDTGTVVGGFDIGVYATDPKHEKAVNKIYNSLDFTSSDDIQNYIDRVAPGSPVTAEMIENTASKYNVPAEMLIAMMQQDSSLGTAGLGARTFNPGNVGNDDEGNIRNYGNWQAGVDAVGEWLNRHRAKADTTEDIYKGLNKQDANIVKAIIDGTYKIKDVGVNTRERIAGALNSAGFKQAISAEMKQEVKSIEQGLKDVQKLWKKVPKRYSGKLQGWLAEKLGASDWNEKVAKFDTAAKIVGMQITRLFEKGRISDNDRDFYLGLMPNLQQNRAAAEASTKEMIKRLNNKVKEVETVGVEALPSDNELADEYDNL